ncbi:MAG: hypothetical protein HY698_14440 [Deltaproteobacteria bacterium]|nr:hypothetical protein [Deltaproteobacteria bacterium]
MAFLRVFVAAQAALGLALASAAPAHAESFSASIRLPAERARARLKIDPKVDALLRRSPLELIADQQDHLVVEMANLSDPRTATHASWRGTLYLQEPAHVGTLRAYYLRDRAGNAVRHRDGTVASYYWYELADGRMARYVTTVAGDAVGTYILDPRSGAYEFAVDLDGDRRIDLLDAVTPDFRERIVMTEIGRDFARLWNGGTNPLCFGEDASGIVPGGFGSGADSRARLPGCRLRHGARAGGATGSLGHPGDPHGGRTPIDQLCDSMGGGKARRPEWFDPLVEEEDYGECEAECAQDFYVCVGVCTVGGALSVVGGAGGLGAAGALVCDLYCVYEAVQCHDDCLDDAAETGTTRTPPAEPTPSPPSTARYRDTDGDGTYDAEDTNGDGAIDTSCSTANCGLPPGTGGTRSRPNPDEGGVSWDLFCKDRSNWRQRGWGSFDPPKDCPNPTESTTKSKKVKSAPNVRAADCWPVDETDVDEVVGQGRTVGCLPGEGRCEPDLIGTIRARFAQAMAAHTVGVQIVCDPIVCQPGLAVEAARAARQRTATRR